MSSLAELRAIARDLYLKIDPNWKIWTNSTLDWYINRGYLQVQKDWWNRRREQQADWVITTIAATSNYPYPSDFLKITGIVNGTLELYKTYKENILKSWLITNTGNPSAYYIYGSNIWLFPIPIATETISYTYNKRLPKITESQDSLFPEDFDDAICLYAVYLGCMSVEKNDKASSIYNEYQNTLSTLLFTYQVDSTDNSYWIDRWEYLPSPRII